jgi:outer membrane protein assembly factor BamB
MRRSLNRLTLLGLLAMLAAACTSAEETTTTATDLTLIAPVTTAPPQESTDAAAPFFEAQSRPANLEWRELAPGRGSTAPAFIHGIDAATGVEAWRLEVPWPQAPWLQLAGDRLIYSYANVGEEDVIVAVGLDGEPLWQSTTNWRFHGPFYTDENVLIGVARARQANVSARYAVVALDIEDGQLLWEAKLRWLPENGEQGSLGSGSGAVYVTRPNGRTIAYEISSGERRWSVKLADRVSGAPLHIDGAVLVGTRSGLVALDAFDGSELWLTDTGNRQIASPEGVASGNAVAWWSNPSNPGFLVAAADLETGNPVWTAESYLQHHVGENAVAGFTFDESQDYPSELKVWDGENGRVLAAVDTGRNLNPFSVAITERDVYVGTIEVSDEPGSLIAIDLSGGVAVWEAPLDGSLGELATDLATVYVPAQQRGEPQRGALFAVARASGEVLWTFDAAMDITTRPVLAEGLVYVVSAEVVALGL